ncbi:MAG: calcium-binding protein [Betaproteobacteria bacterium]|nr:calcium-binding protein [Betaproteobacteria bacterium]
MMELSNMPELIAVSVLNAASPNGSEDLEIERVVSGYLLKVAPSFVADTSSLAVAVYALVDAGQDTALVLAPAFRTIERPNASMPVSLLFPNLEISNALKGLESNVVGLKFSVIEVQAGENDSLDGWNVDYYFPPPIEIAASFSSQGIGPPEPGAPLNIEVSPMESMLGTESMLLFAETFDVQAGDTSPTLRSVKLESLPLLRLVKGTTDYIVDGSALLLALNGIVVSPGQATRIKIAVDSDADGLIASTEPSTIVAYPVLPELDFAISVTSNEVVEGTSAQFLVSVKNAISAQPGKTFDYTLSGPGITPDDIKGGKLSGTFLLDRNGNASIEIGLNNDNRAEGSELLIFSISDKGVWTSSILVKDLGGSLLNELNEKFIVLTAGNDVFEGTVADDVVYGWLGRDSLRGGPGSDVLDGENDDDSLEGGDGDDVLKGGAGKDYLSGDDGDDAIDGGPGSDSMLGGSGNDALQGEEGDDMLIGGDGVDFLSGGSGNDLLYTRLGEDLLIDGDAGIDTVIYTSGAVSYVIENFGLGSFVVSDSQRSIEVSDSLANIERVVVLDPRDSSVVMARAYDLSGNAGIVSKILATVFGTDALNNMNYAGIGLQLLDRDGYRYDSLMKLAIEVALGGAFQSPEQVVKLLYVNVLGVVPSSSEAAPFIELLVDGQRRGQYSDAVASLGMLAADYNAASTANINLVGLSETGLSYTPVSSF